MQVTNFYPPRSGLAEITISVSPGAITGSTDQEGMFVSTGLEEGMYEINVEKQGYAAVDTLVEVNAGEVTTLV